MHKKAQLGLFSIILLGINTVIGTGIYLLPAKPMALVGPSSVLVYLLVTFIVMAIALCFAECAMFFSRNGAAYLYAKEAFGGFVGYQVGVLKWVVSISAWAAVAVGFVMVLGELWPPAMEEPIRSVLITVLVVGLSALNIAGVKHVKLLNNVVALTKLTPLLFFVVFGLFYMRAENFTPFILEEAGLGHLGQASLVIFFAFSGFEALAVAAEEMKNPQKHLPLAIVSVLSIAALVYLLIQLIVVGVLGPELAQSITPIADAASRFFGSGAYLFVLLSTLVSSIGINIACSFTAPRTLEVLAKDKLLPPSLAKANAQGIPVAAIAVSAILTLVAALSGSFVKLAVISVIARLFQYIPTCLAVFVLRKKYAEMTKKLPKTLAFGAPLIGTLSAIWLLFNASAGELFWGVGVVFLTFPFYFMARKKAATV